MDSNDRTKAALAYDSSDARKEYSKQRITNDGVDFASQLQRNVENLGNDKKKEACAVLMSD